MCFVYNYGVSHTTTTLVYFAPMPPQKSSHGTEGKKLCIGMPTGSGAGGHCALAADGHFNGCCSHSRL